jgi:3-dehydroquinate dehydratase/shikimate dehydrogenase
VPVRICVAVRESTTSGAIEAAARAKEWADLVEIRADYIHDLDVRRLLLEKRGPVLFTLRSPDEGGAYRGSEQNRLETIIEAARLGADYIDLEYAALSADILRELPKDRLILSHHDFAGSPDGLESLLDAMAGTGAGILKIAARALRLADNLKIASLLAYASSRKVRLCALAMGREGIPSRILGPGWGSWMTFASLPGSLGTADGQVAADELVQQYRIREIGPGTRVYGVLGKPLGHSLSPQLHNAAFKARKMDAVYLPLESDGIDDFRRFHAAFPVAGVSVTIPYKQDAMTYADSLSDEAKMTGAVNTLVPEGAGWRGENSDVEGFIRPLIRRFRVEGMRAVVLGAGGAARAVVCALCSRGVSVCVVARSPDRARQLSEQFRCECAPWGQLKALRWDLLVNTTPVGMYPELGMTPVPAEWLTGKCVYDLVYNPRRTRLLEEAALKGCAVISGEEMFLGQAVKQQELWCGSPPPHAVMGAVLDAALRNRPGRQSDAARHDSN